MKSNIFFVFLHSQSSFMKRTILLFCISACLPMLTACDQKEASDATTNIMDADTLQLLLLQAKQCSRLYTTEFHVHKIVTYEDLVNVKGKFFNRDYTFRLPLGERKIAFPMEATLKGYIDMEQLSTDSFVRDGDKLTVILPAPKVVMTATKIDQANVKEFVSLARAHFSDRELTMLEQQGRQAIIRNIPSYGIEEQARKSAARLLIPIATKLGFNESNVTIVFPTDFTTASLERIEELKNPLP